MAPKLEMITTAVYRICLRVWAISLGDSQTSNTHVLVSFFYRATSPVSCRFSLCRTVPRKRTVFANAFSPQKSNGGKLHPAAPETGYILFTRIFEALSTSFPCCHDRKYMVWGITDCRVCCSRSSMDGLVVFGCYV